MACAVAESAMASEQGLLEWFIDDKGCRAANIKLGDREGVIRMVPFGKLMRVEVAFPLIASSSDPDSTYLLESAQAWVDDVGARPLPQEP
jgi:hypothetical protein